MLLKMKWRFKYKKVSAKDLIFSLKSSDFDAKSSKKNSAITFYLENLQK